MCTVSKEVPLYTGKTFANYVGLCVIGFRIHYLLGEGQQNADAICTCLLKLFLMPEIPSTGGKKSSHIQVSKNQGLWRTVPALKPQIKVILGVEGYCCV